METEESSSKEGGSSSESNESKEESIVSEESESSFESSQSEETTSVEATLGDDFVSTEDGSMTIINNVYTLLSAGTYTVSGSKVAQIVVNAGDEDKVEIALNGADISYGENSPIYVVNADSVDISAKSGTSNSVTDLREIETVEDETQGNGAIYAKCDLDLKGKGNLNVIGTYNNGVHSTKDLEIKNLTLNVTAPNNAIKGNDSVEVISGNLTLISTGGDGIKTSDSDISSKGNQRGTITIDDGNIDIYSACDGIDASYDVNILGGNINIKTNKYSPYTGEIKESSTKDMYLRTTANNSYRYSVYFYDDNDNYVWSDASYLTSMRGGGRGGTTYYYYELERPANYNNFKIYAFSSSQSENSTSTYVAASKGDTVNSNYDTVTFSISGSSISTNGWTTYSAQSGGGWNGGGPGDGGQGGGSSSSEKSDVSSKGIKADNQIVISGGAIDIESADDGIHANYGEALENGSNGVGDVTISGGELTISSADDGIHADRYLKISGGEINVTKSYEGLEGNQIEISGGSSYVYASDDGVNAGNTGAGLTPKITQSGGLLFAAVPSNGDTDGIDSNGNIVVSGGTMIACGPNSNRGMSALDADGSVSLSGSSTTLLIFGGSEANPSYSTSAITKGTKSSSFSSGKAYTINYSGYSIATGKLVASYSSVTSYSSYGSITGVAAV